MHDTLVKAWALWGDYLDQVFTKVTLTVIEKLNPSDSHGSVNL